MRLLSSAILVLSFWGLLLSQDLLERTFLGLSCQSTELPNLLADKISQQGKQKTIGNIRLLDFQPKSQKSKGINLTMNSDAIKTMKASRNGMLEIAIPVSLDKEIELQVMATDLFTSDAKIQMGDGSDLEITQGQYLFYQGIIKEDHGSVVSIMIANDEVHVFMADQYGSYYVAPFLGNLKTKDDYILYKEDVSESTPFSCGVDESMESVNIHRGEVVKGSNSKSIGDIVEVYIECDKKLYDDKGGMTGTMNYLTTMFAIVSTLYTNEGITVQLTSPKLWNTTDPYVNQSDVFGSLQLFGRTIKNNHPGRLASLVSGRRINGNYVGGIAWLGVLCSNYNSNQDSGPYSYMYGMGIYGLNPYPQRSLDASILAHELGHNFGSAHTHACAWGPQGNKKIDACASEGSCSLVQSPTPAQELGTIMSYCNNIDFTKGFGTEPGARIYNNYVNANCLVSGGPSCTHTTKTYNNTTIPNNTTIYASSTISLQNNVAVSNGASVNLSTEGILQVNGTFTIPQGSQLTVAQENCN